MKFFDDEAKSRIVKAVGDVEALTAAEIVVAVQARSDDYRDVDYRVGGLLAMLTLIVLMYHPSEFNEDLMPVETAAAFMLGVVIVNRIAPLKRALVTKKRIAERTLATARAQFFELGVSRTTGRTGVLVFVSLLERVVCVVPDIGVDLDELEGWSALRGALEAAVAKLDVAAFTTALTALGPSFAKPLPRGENDVNELPDAPTMRAS